MAALRFKLERRKDHQGTKAVPPPNKHMRTRALTQMRLGTFLSTPNTARHVGQAPDTGLRDRQVCVHVSLTGAASTLPGFWTLWGEEHRGSEVLEKSGSLNHSMFPLLCQALVWALTGMVHSASYLPEAGGRGTKTPNPVIPGHSNNVRSHSQRQTRASCCLLLGALQRPY